MDYVRNLYCSIMYSNDSMTPKKIVAFGNVLLDYTVKIDSTEILERYGLELETSGELEINTLQAIRKEVNEFERISESRPHPGGSALNTVRILKQLGTIALFCGAVGNDSLSSELKIFLEEKDISVKLQVLDNYPTGECICFVYQNQKALYANIGASSQFSIDFLKEVENDKEQLLLRPLEKKQIFYIEGFFVPKRQEVCRYIVDQYIKDQHVLAFNLNSAYIINENYEDVLNLVKHSHFLFGNHEEFTTLRTKMGHDTLEDFAESLLGQSETKILIITKGSQNVTLVTNHNEDQSDRSIRFEQFNVPYVENVVDTTGAGDSFVAGFLHTFLAKRSISECIRFAMDIACKVISQVGCNLPS